MTRFVIVVTGIVGLLVFGGCKTTEVQAHWFEEPVQVDGHMTEWIGIPTTCFEESGVQLGLCNDNDNLYISFRFSNQTWARAIWNGWCGPMAG